MGKEGGHHLDTPGELDGWVRTFSPATRRGTRRGTWTLHSRARGGYPLCKWKCSSTPQNFPLITTIVYWEAPGSPDSIEIINYMLLPWSITFITQTLAAISHILRAARIPYGHAHAAVSLAVQCFEDSNPSQLSIPSLTERKTGFVRLISLGIRISLLTLYRIKHVLFSTVVAINYKESSHSSRLSRM